MNNDHLQDLSLPQGAIECPALIMDTPNQDLIACHYCDSLYEKTALGKREKMVCRTCGSTIHSNNADFRAAFIFAQTALILFIIANASPFITLDMGGSVTTISIFSSVQALFETACRYWQFW